MISRHLKRILIFTLLLSLEAFAQTPSPTPLPPQTDEQRKARRELEQKALALLEDVVKDSDSFKLAENRIRIKAAAANILWAHDEVRARTLFREAMVSLADLLNNQETVEQPENPRILESARSLRRDLLQVLAQRDGKLAREFMRATRPPSSQPNNRRNALPDQQIEITLAMQIADKDPKQSLEIAEEILSRGLSYEFPQLISALRQKDPEAAAKLASDVMSKLRTEKLDANHVARQVGILLLREATQTPDDAEKSGKVLTPLLDQQTLRDLTDLLLTEALRPSSTSPDLLSSLQEMFPVVQKYGSPSRIAQLKRTMESQKAAAPGADNEGNGRRSDQSGDDISRYSAIFEKGTTEELLEAAPKAPEALREMLYHRAIEKMMEEGDADRARQLINERIKDPDVRKEMLSQVEEIANFKAAEQGKVESTRKMLATLRTNEERVMALTQLATSAYRRGDKKSALQLLEEARGMSSARAKNFSQLGAQVSVARAYAPLDAARSLAILEPVVDQLNELLGAAIVLGGFITEEIVRDDEIVMEPLTAISQEFGMTFSTDVMILAMADFERTKALADRFQRDEIRITARLMVAQSILLPDAMPGGRRLFTMTSGPMDAPDWPNQER